jgi:hypothetical protein
MIVPLLGVLGKVCRTMGSVLGSVGLGLDSGLVMVWVWVGWVNRCRCRCRRCQRRRGRCRRSRRKHQPHPRSDSAPLGYVWGGLSPGPPWGGGRLRSGSGITGIGVKKNGNPMGGWGMGRQQQRQQPGDFPVVSMYEPKERKERTNERTIIQQPTQIQRGPAPSHQPSDDHRGGGFHKCRPPTRLQFFNLLHIPVLSSVPSCPPPSRSIYSYRLSLLSSTHRLIITQCTHTLIQGRER